MRLAFGLSVTTWRHIVCNVPSTVEFRSACRGLSEAGPDEWILAGRYRLEHPIGSGGMGTVYLGRHLGLGRAVAIKVLEPRPSGPCPSEGRPSGPCSSGSRRIDRSFAPPPAAVARFLREARFAAKVRHRNIVDIYDFGWTRDFGSLAAGSDRPDGGLVYIVMEALVGRDLRAILRAAAARQRLPGWPWALDVMRQVCAAIEAIHRVGVVHRDLKSSNCFVVEPRGLVKLLDFGIAAQERGIAAQERGIAAQERGIAAQERGNPVGDLLDKVVGTPESMAPEQIRGAPPDRRTDVYAAGVLLVELLTGRAPFSGRTAEEVFERHLHARPPRLVAPAWAPEWPHAVRRQLDAIVNRALAKRPRERFQSMAELAAALEQIEPSVLRQEIERP